MSLPVLRSVGARPSPEDPAEEPPEGLQPDGAAGGQRLAAADRGVHAQLDPDHGRGQFLGRCWDLTTAARTIFKPRKFLFCRTRRTRSSPLTSGSGW